MKRFFHTRIDTPLLRNILARERPLTETTLLKYFNVDAHNELVVKYYGMKEIN